MINMLYFAYGSNMCTDRLRAPDRVPSAKSLGIARISGYAFRFHKVSKKDCSAKADAYYTGNPTDTIWGVIFSIDPAEKPNLDRAEGLGGGYDEKEFTVTDMEGNEHRTVAYIAEPSHIQKELLPYSWYKRFVVEGARRSGLSSEYIAQIDAMPATEDPDRARDARNRKIVC